MKTETVQPNIKNFIKSLRDIGYSFEIAVADIIDNSITAKAKQIDILIIPEPDLTFELLDNGTGMCERDLVEAMRLATKNPDEKREKNDLGRFGLGLKTASFSQCKKLTVITKNKNKIYARRWDLDYLAIVNEWELITPEANSVEQYRLYSKFQECESGTLVVWEEIDRYNKKKMSTVISDLGDHLSLVFHRFLEARPGTSKIGIRINGRDIKPFDPFNKAHPATQQIPDEKINLYGDSIVVQPFILPHHSKIGRNDYDFYATTEGYIKSQGFYLYRENRLLIYGTWWGLHKASDAHKLVRIKIDISSEQDKYWGIDVKKSKASPSPEVRSELKRIIKKVTVQGSRPYSGRGRRIRDNNTTRLWCLVPHNEKISFELNQDHPSYTAVMNELNDNQTTIVNQYLKAIQSYIPIEAIQAQLQERPHDIDQKSILNDDEAQSLIMHLQETGNELADIIMTEIYKDRVGNDE